LRNRFKFGSFLTRILFSGYYDTDYHLKSETIAADPAGNNGAETYTYDAVGNRQTLASTIPSLPGSVSYSHDLNDRLTTDTYDNDGNTISSGGTASTYDFENHMLTHGAVSMVYDGDGNRVSETAAGVTTKYLVDTLNPTGYSQVLDELVSGSVTKTYTYGRQRISENQLVSSTWTPTFYGYDGHGNVRFTINTAGTVGNTYQFDAFGMSIASAGTIANSYLYSGERFDSNLNLYHLRARYYNQATGRFETMDPAAGSISDPGTLHKYAYARNNPVNRIDPSGRDDVAEYSLFAKITASATLGIFLGAELREIYDCAAEALASSGSEPEPLFPVVQRPAPPSIGPLPERGCSETYHDESPSGAPEGNPLGPVQNPPGTEGGAA
jgi:RHS repeat-associated protein